MLVINKPPGYASQKVTVPRVLGTLDVRLSVPVPREVRCRHIEQWTGYHRGLLQLMTLLDWCTGWIRQVTVDRSKASMVYVDFDDISGNLRSYAACSLTASSRGNDWTVCQVWYTERVLGVSGWGVRASLWKVTRLFGCPGEWCTGWSLSCA